MKVLMTMLILTIPVGGLVSHGTRDADADTPFIEAHSLDVEIAPFVGPCRDDLYCGGNMHEMVEGDAFQEDNHSCLEPAMHSGPACGVTFHPNDVLSAGATRLAAMLSAPETNVSLHVERHAIQVRGCTGSIIAHLPLRDGAIAAILSDL